MKSRIIMSAVFKFRNISVLLLWYSGVFLLYNIFQSIHAESMKFDSPIGLAFYFGGLTAYLLLVFQTLLSKSFYENYNLKERIRQIKQLDNSSYRLTVEAKKSINSIYHKRLRKVVEDKNEILEAFFRGEHSFLKEKIVEQTLNLVISYIKLLINFSVRNREINNTDISEVVNRISTNTRKLSFIKDPITAYDIQNSISMDEKIVSRIKDEKVELERINAKLEYIESMVNMFKHQIISSIESEEMLEKLERAVTESAALDNVLEERKRNNLRA